MANSRERAEAFDQAAAQTRFQFEGSGRGVGVAAHVLAGRWRVDYDDPWFTGSLVYDLREEEDGLKGYLVEIVDEDGQSESDGSLIFELRNWDGTKGEGLYSVGYEGIRYEAECVIEIVMLGYNPILVLLSEVLVQQFQAILHTETIRKLPRPIEFLFNTPSHHRVHHGSNRQYWDRNYAGMLIIWDRMSGTFEPEVEKVRYGIDRPINSNNPLVVFLHGIHRLGSKLLATNGLQDKLRVLVKPPDWEAD